MSGLRHHLRLALIAFAAVVGTLSMVGDASASTSNGTAACCLKRACTVCCCVSPRVESSERPTALPTNGPGVATPPAPPCECRSNNPATPAPGPVSRPDDHGSDRVGGDSFVPARPFAPAVPIALPANGRPTAPLYLRTTRLLI